jgi:UTP--glucose-1-phosphate uridylyltransferase
MLKVRKVVIPVAGLGTRVLPASKAIPKEMMPVVDKPVIQYVVEEAVAAGIKEIILVTRTGKSAIEDHFDAHYELEAELARKNKTALLAAIQHIVPPDVSIVSIRQPEAKGLGHAVYCAASMIGDEPFVVILPDVLVNNEFDKSNDLARMISEFEGNGAAQIMVGEVPDDKVHLYGIVDCDGIVPAFGQSAAIKGLIEKPSQDVAPSNLAVIGRYVLPGRMMSLLADGKPGAGGEIQLTDAIDALLTEQSVEAYKMMGATYDCGEKLGYLKANIAYGLQHSETAGGLKEFIKALAIAHE